MAAGDVEYWANVGTIVTAFSVPLSALFIWLQLRLQTRLAKVANTQSLVELSSPFNLQLIQDPQMAKYWVRGAQEYQGYDDVEKYRYKSLLIWWLILHENIFFQWQRGMLDEAVFKSWRLDLDSFSSSHLNKNDMWNELKPPFEPQPDFVRHVEASLRSANANMSPGSKTV